MNLPAGHRLVHFERIDSTNAETRRLAEWGEKGPLWIWADEQTAGRGRLGRTWVSEPGNLYATFLFTLAAGPAVASQASFVAALAVHDTVMALDPRANAQIKWPNDVLAGGAKVAGILAEGLGGTPFRLALGMGLNLAHAPQGTPYPAACLGPQFAPESVLQLLAARLWECLQIWNEGEGFAAIRSGWLARAAGLNDGAVAQDGTAGRFTGLAPDGALILTGADGRPHHIHAGDVRFAGLEKLRKATHEA